MRVYKVDVFCFAYPLSHNFHNSIKKPIFKIVGKIVGKARFFVKSKFINPFTKRVYKVTLSIGAHTYQGRALPTEL
jgi:hypothetical protein